MKQSAYTEIKNNIVKNLPKHAIIKKYMDKIEYYNNDHATCDITVSSNNKAYFNKVMEKIKEENKEYIEYISFSKTDYSSQICIKFFDDKEICKPTLTDIIELEKQEINRKYGRYLTREMEDKC